MPRRRVETSWEPVAEWYRSLLYGEEPTYQKTVILPNLRRLLALKPGMKVLDIACGPGYFSRELLRAGATVTGADISAEFVAAAEAAVAELGGAVAARSRFFVAPSHQLAEAADRSFDVAIIVLAIQNIEKAAETIAEAGRKLKPGGRLLLVLNHPCFRMPRGSAWGWDEAGKQYRRVDRYLSEWKVGLQAHPGSDPKALTVSFHRPIQYYFKCLTKAGFLTRAVEEWISDRRSAPGPHAAEENRARAEFPLFLCLEAVKPA
jgi:SAM-dependent methyltransferase